jgi:2'-5' RNA ligase
LVNGNSCSRFFHPEQSWQSCPNVSWFDLGMAYALIHYPAIDTAQINELRHKYDPQVDLLAPHITLVFPVLDSIGEAGLVAHIGNVLRNWRQFPLRLQGLKQSWDNCLFLLLQEGNAEVIHLHDELYTGMLAPYLRQDISYVPHVTLGSFADDAELCSQALSEAEHCPLDYRCVVDRLHLVRVNDDRSGIIWSKEFLLPT